MIMEKHENNSNSNLLYSFLTLHLDIAHLYLQFHCIQGRVLKVSVVNKEYN